MKFIAPEVEVLKFDVADVLTTSEGGATSDTAAAGHGVSAIGMPCAGNSTDDFFDDCI